MTGPPLIADDDPGALLADHQRDTAATIVAHAFEEGRLDDNEHEARAALVQSARTRGDLAHALDGIPASAALTPSAAPPRREPPLLSRSAAHAAMLAGVVLLSYITASSPRDAVDADAAGALAARQHLAQVVRAEQSRHARTRRYTDDDASLQLANRQLLTSDALDDVHVDLADDRRGAVLTSVEAFGVTLIVALDEHGRAEWRCTATFDHECPRLPR